MELTMDSFTTGWAQLCAVRGLEVNDSQAIAYFTIIAHELTAEEFQAAIVLCIRNLNRLPTVKEMVETVKPSPEVLAAREWANILSQVDCNQPTQGVSSEALAALQIVGGRRAVIEASHDQRQRFYRVWQMDYLDRSKRQHPCLKPEPQMAIEGGS